MVKKAKFNGDQQKQLYEWAEGEFSEGKGQVQQFLDFCKYYDKEVHEATDIVSYTKFLTLKEKFEA